MTVAGCIAQPRLTGGLHLRDLHYGLDCSFRHLAHNGAGNPGELAGRLPKVTFTHDVVAVEDTPCLVTGYLHCNPLRNPSPDHIPNSRTPQVMEQEPRLPHPNPRSAPCAIKAPNRLAVPMKDPRDDPILLSLEPGGFVPLPPRQRGASTTGSPCVNL